MFCTPSPSARVFSRDILKGGGNIGVLAGGRGVLGVYYIVRLFISPGFFFSGSEKMC